MNPAVDPALRDYVLAMADDELILGHRDAEWTGHAPILEEDIAFANLALDEIGHAALWYALLAGWTGADPQAEPDRLAYFREPEEFLSAQLVELPRGDWAFTMVRQYLFDQLEEIRLGRLAAGPTADLAGTAEKIRREENYHLRHTRAWIKRLGQGTEESQRRTQAALDALWPYALQLFEPQPGEVDLVRSGLIPDPAALRQMWEREIRSFLVQSGLRPPESSDPVASFRSHASVHRRELIQELQEVARSERHATW